MENGFRQAEKSTGNRSTLPGRDREEAVVLIISYLHFFPAAQR
jgi:hypothetical protein